MDSYVCTKILFEHSYPITSHNASSRRTTAKLIVAEPDHLTLYFPTPTFAEQPYEPVEVEPTNPQQTPKSHKQDTPSFAEQPYEPTGVRPTKPNTSATITYWPRGPGAAAEPHHTAQHLAALPPS